MHDGDPFGALAPAPAGSASLAGFSPSRRNSIARCRPIRAAKADGSAVWTLFGLSFAYGIFHAAGPGHGKAVISSYMVANGETWRRGVVLSFVSAMMQALWPSLVVDRRGAAGRDRHDHEQTVYWIEDRRATPDHVGGRAAALGERTRLHRGVRAARPTAIVRVPALTAPGVAVMHGHEHDMSTLTTIMCMTIIRITIMRMTAMHISRTHGQSMRTRSRSRRALGTCARAGAAGARRPRRLAARTVRRSSRSGCAVLGRHPGAGVRAGAGPVLGRDGRDLRDGLGTAITVAAIATLAVGAKSLAQRFAVMRRRPRLADLRGVELGGSSLVLAFGLALLAGYIASERLI